MRGDRLCSYGLRAPIPPCGLRPEPLGREPLLHTDDIDGQPPSCTAKAAQPPGPVAPVRKDKLIILDLAQDCKKGKPAKTRNLRASLTPRPSASRRLQGGERRRSRYPLSQRGSKGTNGCLCPLIPVHPFSGGWTGVPVFIRKGYPPDVRGVRVPP